MDCSNIYHTVNADSAPLYTYGYFSNDLDSLRKAVNAEKTTLKVIYLRLEYVLEDNNERRFGTKVGIFSLFYPLDKEKDEGRY